MIFRFGESRSLPHACRILISSAQRSSSTSKLLPLSAAMTNFCDSVDVCFGISTLLLKYGLCNQQPSSPWFPIVLVVVVGISNARVPARCIALIDKPCKSPIGKCLPILKKVSNCQSQVSGVVQ